LTINAPVWEYFGRTEVGPNHIVEAFDQLSQGVTVVDENLDLIVWNKTVQNLLDLPGEIFKVGTNLERRVRILNRGFPFGSNRDSL